VSMSDKPKERNILKLILIVRFACVTLDVGQPIYVQANEMIRFDCGPPEKSMSRK
jgi:hypothetical protein